jgi:glycine cleavage system aminomethyltransferase T
MATVKSTTEVEKMLPHTVYSPYFPEVNVYATMGMPGATPYEYTDWRDETKSWKQTCYIHAGLNPTTTYMFKGPDIIKFLSKVCVTNFNNYPVGMLKHGVMCNEKGEIIQDGVLLRSAEDEVVSFWMTPCLNYALDSGKYGKFDVAGSDLTSKKFLLQIGGPTSIDTLEGALGESLRELKFLRSRNGVIAGQNIRVARIGMAGTLSYEVHGDLEDCRPVYEAIWEVGKQYGIRRLGTRCYPMNHAENGYPQYGVHFLYPWYDDADLMRYMAGGDTKTSSDAVANTVKLTGSYGTDIKNFIYTPYDFGWDRMIRFDHEFVGREALEKLSANNSNTMVSLEWNADDVADVFASQFRDGEPYEYIEEPNFKTFDNGFVRTACDKVLNEKGEPIGRSFGRQNAAYFQRMISICCINKKYAEEGKKVIVVWGEEGKKQKEIRAKVARFPYNNVLRNERIDVSTLPRAEKVF